MYFVYINTVCINNKTPLEVVVKIIFYTGISTLSQVYFYVSPSVRNPLVRVFLIDDIEYELFHFATSSW